MIDSTMSALTDREKKRIMDQYREMMAKRGYRVFLTVFCDIKNLEEAQNIMHSIRMIKGVESVSYTNASNVISVEANWKESDVNFKVQELRKIPKVVDVTARILRPLY